MASLDLLISRAKGKKLRWYDCMEEIKAAMNCMLLGMDHATTGEATDGISSFNT